MCIMLLIAQMAVRCDFRSCGNSGALPLNVDEKADWRNRPICHSRRHSCRPGKGNRLVSPTLHVFDRPHWHKLAIREADAFDLQLQVAAAPHAAPCLRQGHDRLGIAALWYCDQIACQHRFNYLKCHLFPSNGL